MSSKVSYYAFCTILLSTKTRMISLFRLHILKCYGCFLFLDIIFFPSDQQYKNDIWHNSFIPKHMLLAWSALNDRLLTKALFVKRKFVLQHEDLFSIYHFKFVTHLFLHCQDSWSLWNSFVNWFDFTLCIPHSLDDLILH